MDVEYISRIVIDVPLTIVENYEYESKKFLYFTYIICDSEHALSADNVYKLAKKCGLVFFESGKKSRLRLVIFETKSEYIFDIYSLTLHMEELVDILKQNGVNIKEYKPEFYIERKKVYGRRTCITDYN